MPEFLLELSLGVFERSTREFTRTERPADYFSPIERRFRKGQPILWRLTEQWLQAIDRTRSFRFGRTYAFSAIDHQLEEEGLVIAVVEDDIALFIKNYDDCGGFSWLREKTKQAYGPLFRRYIVFGMNNLPQKPSNEEHFMSGVLLVTDLMIQKIEAARLARQFPG